MRQSLANQIAEAAHWLERAAAGGDDPVALVGMLDCAEDVLGAAKREARFAARLSETVPSAGGARG